MPIFHFERLFAERELYRRTGRLFLQMQRRFCRQKSNPAARPGRICPPRLFHCQSTALNDCDRSGANCLEQDDGYTCQCKPGFEDVGGPARPGRNCRQRINECADPSLNTCHPLATCTDLPDGYKCQCNPNTYDTAQTDNINLVGRQCIPRKLYILLKSLSHSFHASL